VKKTAIIISLLSLLSAFVVNEINLHWLRKDGVELRNNETIITADDASYLSPVENYLASRELKNNTPDKSAFFMRPPGYSAFILMLGDSLFLVKITQLLLFALSIYCLFFIAFDYLDSKKWAIAITSIYGITNIASGFLYYTLTEGITPALVVFFVYFLSIAGKQTNSRKKTLFYYLSSVIFAYLFLTRPVLGVFAIAIPVLLIKEYWNNKKILLIQLICTGVISFGPMALWQVRNYNIANEYVGLHPIYYSENSSSVFRPTHQALWELCKGWGEEGANFHGYIGPFWNAAILGDTTADQRKKVISSFPKYVVESLGEKRIDEMLTSYQASILHQKPYFNSGSPMPKELPEIEKETISKINSLAKDYKKEYWFQYHIISPIVVFKKMTFHSNLSLYIFQKSFRGSFIMEGFRIFCFGIHSVAFLLVFMNFFIKKPHRLKVVFTTVLLLYFFYLVYVQRGIEERYTLPLLSLILISATGMIQRLIRKIRW